jgi:hypothetical protein
MNHPITWHFMALKNNRMRKTLVSFLLLCSLLLHRHAYSQRVIINGKEKHRQLTWQDFTGNPDNSSDLHAYTYYNLRYQYRNVSYSGESATLGDFEVTLELDPQKSWAKKDKLTDELLVHEQGHFNIGILCMRELLAIVKQTAFARGDYAARLQNIFNETMAKYNKLTIQYDQETNHFMDKEQQSKWNQFFSEKLGKR